MPPPCGRKGVFRRGSRGVGWGRSKGGTVANGDVTTVNKRGQWVNEVEGDRSRSWSFSSKEKAIQAGQALAEESGAQHTVVDEDSTGVITDPGMDEGGEANA